MPLDPPERSEARQLLDALHCQPPVQGGAAPLVAAAGMHYIAFDFAERLAAIAPGPDGARLDRVFYTGSMELCRTFRFRKMGLRRLM